MAETAVGPYDLVAVPPLRDERLGFPILYPWEALPGLPIGRGILPEIPWQLPALLNRSPLDSGDHEG